MMMVSPTDEGTLKVLHDEMMAILAKVKKLTKAYKRELRPILKRHRALYKQMMQLPGNASFPDRRRIAHDVREARLSACRHEPGDPRCNCGDD